MVAVIELSASHSLATKAINVWHWRIPESNSVTEVDACIDALDTFYTAIASRIQTGVVTIGPLARTVDQNPNEYIQGTTETVSTSGAAGAPLATAACLSLKSSLVGGSRRGRKYLGPMYASAVNSDGRTIATGVSNEITSAAATLMGTSTAGVELGIWSRTLNVFTPVTAVSVNPVVAIQRRRVT